MMLMFRPRTVCAVQARLQCFARLNSTAAPAPPLLQKLRNDLKTAMREKDKSRLNVVRAILSDVTNAAKTASPVRTDVQILAMLRKRVATSTASRQEFVDAGRQDLQEREDAEIAVMQSYAHTVKTMSDDDLCASIDRAIQQSSEKPNLGHVIKTLTAPGGELDGKAFERSSLARLVKDRLT